MVAITVTSRSRHAIPPDLAQLGRDERAHLVQRGNACGPLVYPLPVPLYAPHETKVMLRCSYGHEPGPR